jgi:hypothetical protein
MFDPLTAASNVSGVAGPSGQGVADLEGGEDEGRGLFGELQEGSSFRAALHDCFSGR